MEIEVPGAEVVLRKENDEKPGLAVEKSGKYDVTDGKVADGRGTKPGVTEGRKCGKPEVEEAKNGKLVVTVGKGRTTNVTEGKTGKPMTEKKSGKPGKTKRKCGKPALTDGKDGKPGVTEGKDGKLDLTEERNGKSGVTNEKDGKSGLPEGEGGSPSVTDVVPDGCVGKSLNGISGTEAAMEYEITNKHPLQRTWVLWFFKQEKEKQWSEYNQRKLATFDTVEDFWSVFNYIKQASKLSVGCDYSLFKDGIEPIWEDAANERGGRWVLGLAKRNRSTDLDTFWLETCLGLIGGAFDENGDEICGAVVNIRSKGAKIGLWNRDSRNECAVKAIERELRFRLNLQNKYKMEYYPHFDINRTVVRQV